MGMIAEIVDIMKNLKENEERATPETVLALAVRNEGGEKDGSREHEQRESAEIA